MKNPINCHLCGKCIPKPANGQIYCEECRKNLYKEKQRNFYEARKRKKQKSNKPSLSDIMHEATKEGLQYVAYCKKHRLY